MSKLTDKSIKRALSMWQPWASLLVAGIKILESRGNDTAFRGEFYVHATGTIPKAAYDHCKDFIDFRILVNQYMRSREPNVFNPQEDTRIYTRSDLRAFFITGAIIGKATLVDSMPSWDLKKIWESERRHTDWEREYAVGIHDSDRWAWICENPQQYIAASCIPAKGRQSQFWEVPESLISLLDN